MSMFDASIFDSAIFDTEAEAAAKRDPIAKGPPRARNITQSRR